MKKVWLPSNGDLQPTKLMSREKYLEFDLEVYPIGNFSNRAILIIYWDIFVRYSRLSFFY